MKNSAGLWYERYYITAQLNSQKHFPFFPSLKKLNKNNNNNEVFGINLLTNLPMDMSVFVHSVLMASHRWYSDDTLTWSGSKFCIMNTCGKKNIGSFVCPRVCVLECVWCWVVSDSKCIYSARIWLQVKSKCCLLWRSTKPENLHWP